MTDATHRTARAQDRLRILYSFPHPIGAPGIGWTAWNQVVELIADGHEVHVVAAAFAKPVDGAASRHTTMSIAGRRVPHRLLGGDRAYDLHDRRAERLLRRLAPDIVHGWPLGCRRTCESARELGIASVREAPNTHTAHAYAVVAREIELLGIEMPHGASHTFNSERLAIEEREWAAATAVLAPSETVANTFAERGLAPERLLRHRYGARPEPGPVAERRPDRPFTAVFLGRGEPRKGLHHALRAWLSSSACDGGRFLIHGSLVPAYRESLQAMLDHPSVEYRGFADDPRAVLADADVLLLPTVEEGSALVTYEAQLAGCVPLVSTAAGALLTDSVHGLLHRPGDVATLAAQLDRLSADPAALARMRANALAHAEELTWAAANVTLVGAYRAAIGLAELEASVARPTAAEGAGHAVAE
ncbi:glycosyltransferase family 4 protein [Agromyces sp. LHK192]|uniref:glycosyltransferase family 4 protein n=1 Tax=Agromyces sp. LHK192 TaxID=2498704 RepID=UPI000FDCB1B4|nr:glycosyltransferase family 4 protein [Agromyces sp. LHK192]